MATIARTRHYGHGRGGKVVVVTRKLAVWEQSRPSYLHSTIPHPSPGPGLSSKHTIRNRDVLQCSVSRQFRAWRSFSPCWGEQRSCKLSGEGGREAVSGVKGSKHTAQHQSGGAKLQESLSPSLLTLCFLNPDLDRYQEYKDSQGSSSSPPLCVHPTPDTTVAS